MSESFSIPTPGDVIAGKYRVIEELGRGAYGVVFRATQTDLGRDVALKTLLPQAFLHTDIVQRFQREAQLISLLDHGNIIKLYDYGVDEGLLYMAVEYVEGRTLSDLIKTEAPLPPMKAREITFMLLDALEYAHAQGVVHRDLKPDNIVLLKSNPLEGITEEVVKVLDFGIAKLQQDEHGSGALKTLTQDGTVLGTPHYMSPENIVGDPIDHRADIYAIGVILYEMLTGEHPFEAQSPSAVMVRHLRDDAPYLPGTLEGSTLDVAVQACLEKQPEDRIESAVALRELLNSNQTADLEERRQTEEQEEMPPPKQANPAIYAMVGALITILMLSIAWKFWLAKEAVDSPEPVVVATPDLGNAPEPDMAPKIEEPVEEPVIAKAPDLGSADMGADAEGDAGEIEFSMDEGLRVRNPDRRKKPKEPKEPKEAVEKPDENAVEKVAIFIKSTPSDASVTLDGAPIGNTPLTRKIGRSDKQVVIRVSLLGYKNKTIRVVPDKDVQVDVRLDYERIKMLD